MFSLNGVADPSCVPNRTKIRVELHLPDPLLPLSAFSHPAKSCLRHFCSFEVFQLEQSRGLSLLLLSYRYALAKARGIISRLQ